MEKNKVQRRLTDIISQNELELKFIDKAKMKAICLTDLHHKKALKISVQVLGEQNISGLFQWFLDNFEKFSTLDADYTELLKRYEFEREMNSRLIKQNHETKEK